MKTFDQKSFYQIQGGYFTSSDPNFIYVRDGLSEELEFEVTQHEIFHRTLATSTIYGGIHLIIDNFLKNSWEKIPGEIRQGLLNFRNKMFENMVITQEAGALARVHTLIGFFYNPKSQEEMDRIHREYFLRLPENYRSLADYYVSFLLNIFNKAGLKLIPPSVMHFTNDTIMRFIMNPMDLYGNMAIPLDVNSSLFFNEKINPDTRFNAILNVLSQEENQIEFVQGISILINQVFGIEDLYAPDAIIQLHKNQNSNDRFEEDMLWIIDQVLQKLIPAFAVTEHQNSNFKELVSWISSLTKTFQSVDPDFDPGIIIAADLDAKKAMLYSRTKKF